jgi:hypothetical protein
MQTLRIKTENGRHKGNAKVHNVKRDLFRIK